jgi:hypothetical protein
MQDTTKTKTEATSQFDSPIDELFAVVMREKKLENANLLAVGLKDLVTILGFQAVAIRLSYYVSAEDMAHLIADAKLKLEKRAENN